MTLVQGSVCPLLVIYDDGKIFVVDNRCPHLGFPLHRGSVEDGILTCYWYHTRFDAATGGTFDLWADDVPTAAVELRDDGAFWVCQRIRYADGDNAIDCGRACDTILAWSSPRRCSALTASPSTITI